MITKKFLLTFPDSLSENPIIYNLVKDFDLVINIFRAEIAEDEKGYLVLDLTGTEENLNAAIEFIKHQNIIIDETNKGLRWIEDRCTHCGNCTTTCPTGALSFCNYETRQICFDDEECIECLSCLQVCPFGACVSIF